MSHSLPVLSSAALTLQARERIILALDFPSAQQAFSCLEDLRTRSPAPPSWVKVGLELFLAEGPSLVHTLRKQGYSVFLDLKLHDIPNTVGSAIRAIASLDVKLLTVHAAGGPAMLRAAAEAAAALATPPRLLAVTVLTSMNARELVSVGVQLAPQEQVLRLAREARDAGIQGLVASPLEAALLRKTLGSNLHLVTPGIRLNDGQETDDQQRTSTPGFALRAGANQLVIGRPITRAVDPVVAYESILSEVVAADEHSV